MLQYPDTAELRKRLHACLPLVRSWEGTFYRATAIDYADRKSLLDGAGSRRAGGRWNPPGVFGAVYGCLEPETAMIESLANYREFGVPVSKAMPLVFVAVSVALQAVLDLTTLDVQRALGVSVRRMTTTNWPQQQEQGREALTQAIGRIAWEEKLEAILVPSARRNRAQNIVLFSSRRRRGSSWKIHRARKLPRTDA